MARDCSSPFSCRVCNRKYHTLLHSETTETAKHPLVKGTQSPSIKPDHSSSSATVATTTADSSPPYVITPQTQACVAAQTTTENIFLLTVIVKIVDAFGYEHLARALLDSASQPNMMTERMANILSLQRSKVNITIQGAGQLSKPVSTSAYTEVKARKGNFSCGVTFLVMDKVTADLPKHNVSITNWQLPPDLFLADPSFNQSQPIDLVLGAKHFHSFFPSAAKIHLSNNLPILMDSVFGWVVTGANIEEVASYSVSVVSMLTLDESLERFWKTEELFTTSTLSEEELHCESVFASTVKRTPTGRYTVRLPKKPDFALLLGESKTNTL